ncbi:putative selenate reductase subunit YgfK [Tenuifilum thalassicum]|uniref:Putative selenate reductase subunit YgfK n=1 Tax=Tenuifilum thalassicum TaxID=2590900 RepID=A0A7D4BJX8_9BACT|nr:putative selenate reductase subunit YgfK [Tenuifilum thalassicum]QKG79899.1 putative selenate reductase subunit YgfK [Tenuifilum thalassicum]
MSDKFSPIPVDRLLGIILKEFERNNSIFGYPAELFFNPNHGRLPANIFGQQIDTPIGVAAGPHTQMALNIIVAWLMGARYIELKTIQTLDELEIAKPCIDMQDEGYNCEWSQELKVEESFNEYLKAWIIIHLLSHKLGFGDSPNAIFNMSVGYNLEGIKKPNVQWFLDKMSNAATEINEMVDKISHLYPEIKKVHIPTKLSDNITLSTMHGCPANEIEDIARYLLTERKLHTFVKLNPTLLGSEKLREILNHKLDFKTEVPDIAFEHDLKYPDALKLIKALNADAEKLNLFFGVKLTNTLESVNNKHVFPSDVDMMYMSGRALHPISINLAKKLQNEFGGKLLMSFSAGADTFNISQVMGCGFKTVTVSSDLLKPGGYGRLKQYISNLKDSFGDNNISWPSGDHALENLNAYAEETLSNKRYQNENFKSPSIKTARKLDYFDCIAAPCVDTCATNQDIPAYMHFASEGNYPKALEVILRTNPFPNTTGMVCDHLCQNKCTRINYDNSLQIRDIKRFIAENADIKLSAPQPNGKKVCIIGAGPSGLSCAFYLALHGFKVDVFESKSKAGGMVRYAIPGFRLTDEAIDKDISRIEQLGVKITYNHKVTRDEFSKLKDEYNYLYISAGAQKSAPFQIDGIDSKGVIDPLTFLIGVKSGEIKDIGKQVVIIGGGNTAMDAARTAHRLVGPDGEVTVVYRRTINEMPADEGEIKAVIAEGVEIIELASPEKVIAENGKVKALLCSKMKLEGTDSKGRPKPVKLEGSEFQIECNTIIPAVGQALDIDFVPTELLKADTRNYKTLIGNVYIGGDALRGAATAIKAIGDGRKAAEQIITNSGLSKLESPIPDKKHSYRELMIKRTERKYGYTHKEPSAKLSRTFNLVSQTPDVHTITKESSRCLHCDEVCNICTTVCPNMANFAYTIKPVRFQLEKVLVGSDGTTEIQPDFTFEVKQEVQILNIANFCNECGNCSTFCPTQGAPYMDKPKFHLTIKSFKENEEGYMLSLLKDRNVLIFKQKGGIKTLTETTEEYIYETDHVYARFDKKTFKLNEAKALTPCVRQIQFQHAAEMSVILEGAKQVMGV